MAYPIHEAVSQISLDDVFEYFTSKIVDEKDQVIMHVFMDAWYAVERRLRYLTYFDAECADTYNIHDRFIDKFGQCRWISIITLKFDDYHLPMSHRKVPYDVFIKTNDVNGLLKCLGECDRAKRKDAMSDIVLSQKVNLIRAYIMNYDDIVQEHKGSFIATCICTHNDEIFQLLLDTVTLNVKTIEKYIEYCSSYGYIKALDVLYNMCGPQPFYRCFEKVRYDGFYLIPLTMFVKPKRDYVLRLTIDGVEQYVKLTRFGYMFLVPEYIESPNERGTVVKVVYRESSKPIRRLSIVND